MAYTTYAEIEADFKEIAFTTTSTVKAADVTAFIVEADALINAYVGTVYTVPVASGDGLNLLKLLCRSLVAARIKRIMEVKQEKNPDPSQNVLGVLLAPSAVMKILKDLQDKKLTLEGATLLSTGGGFYSNNVANSVEPVVTKDGREW